MCRPVAAHENCCFTWPRPLAERVARCTAPVDGDVASMSAAISASALSGGTSQPW